MLNINQDRYVYFDENGEITKITNYKEDENASFVKVDYKLVEKIMEGSLPSFNFMVIYDISIREYVIKPKISMNEFTYTVNDRIHEIKKNLIDADLTIIQDIKNACWKFNINDSLRSQLLAQNISINTPLFFSITKKHNPHILYRTIEVKFSEILEQLDFSVPFVYNDENTTTLSVYTIKKMQSYKYEVLND